MLILKYFWFTLHRSLFVSSSFSPSLPLHPCPFSIKVNLLQLFVCKPFLSSSFPIYNRWVSLGQAALTSTALFSHLPMLCFLSGLTLHPEPFQVWREQITVKRERKMDCFCFPDKLLATTTRTQVQLNVHVFFSYALSCLLSPHKYICL